MSRIACCLLLVVWVRIRLQRVSLRWGLVVFGWLAILDHSLASWGLVGRFCRGCFLFLLLGRRIFCRGLSIVLGLRLLVLRVFRRGSRWIGMLFCFFVGLIGVGVRVLRV